MSDSVATCPLCECTQVVAIHSDRQRHYLQCEQCELVFVPEAFWLSHADELAHYQTHQNDVDDPAYRAFLSRLADPLMNELLPESHGLDYGCGPGPALAAILTENGHRMTVYDPYFANDREALDTKYDFVTSTEAFEHFNHPRRDIDRVFSMVRPGGVVAVMTLHSPPVEQFADWYYHRDPTHVAFYHPATFRWIASQYKAHLTVVSNSVVLLRTAELIPTRPRSGRYGSPNPP